MGLERGKGIVSTKDITSPSALLFVDALGETLPFRNSFTFKELSDFCRREGVMHLAGTDQLSEDSLLKIAKKISVITNDNIRIIPEPLKKTSGNRTPLSKIDMEVAHHVADESTCGRCNAKTDYRLYCDACRKKGDVLFGKPSPYKEKRPKKTKIHMGALVLLPTGEKVHVVDKKGSRYVGVDDNFLAYEFVFRDAVEVHNLDDPITVIAYDRCPICGESMLGNKNKCVVCGYERDIPSVDWGGLSD